MSFLSKLFGPSAPNLSVVELSEKMKYGKHPLILDVRQPDEFRQGHIAGAKLMSLNELYRRMGELSKSREIVCICASGNRSAKAVSPSSQIDGAVRYAWPAGWPSAACV